jgi:hypothetical protein
MVHRGFYSGAPGANFGAPERIDLVHSGSFGAYFRRKKGRFPTPKGAFIRNNRNTYMDVAMPFNSITTTRMSDSLLSVAPVLFAPQFLTQLYSSVSYQSRKHLLESSQWDRTLLLHQTRWVVLEL